MEAENASPGTLQRWAEVCGALAETSSKLAKRALLAEYLRSRPVADAALAALYTAGEPFAEADGRQLGVGGSLLSKAVMARTGADARALSLALRRHGDMGAAAEELIAAGSSDLSGPVPTLRDLEQVLAGLAAARGPAPRLRLLTDLLARATAPEAKFVLKLVSGDMRIGVKSSLVEEAIAAAWDCELAQVRRAGMLLGNLGEVVQRAAARTLEGAAMRLFHPLGFMLASPVDSVDEAVARFAEEIAAEEGTAAPGDAAVKPETLLPETVLREAQLEDKYDGMRAQLHAGDRSSPGRVGLFSRSREDLRAAFPELVEAFAALEEAVILDGEILAWAPAGNGVEARALPFSSLQQRLGRKVVPPAMRREVPVVFMAFDLLYADGRLWLDEPLRARRARLEQYLADHATRTDGSLTESAGQGALFEEEAAASAPMFPRLVLAPAACLASAAQLDAAYGEARARGNEGVMLKACASSYQPGRRGLAWLKLKRELGTLDVVVTGAEFGSGRRARHLSDYTFAVRGPVADELLNVGKAYSGVTDAEMRALSEHFHATTREDFGNFRTVAPDTVLEVAFNNITRSDRHSSGFALRFPRILRIRTDKPVAEIDTVARVEELYNQQPDRPREQAGPLPAATPSHNG